jgi:hypothetical protein
MGSRLTPEQQQYLRDIRRYVTEHRAAEKRWLEFHKVVEGVHDLKNPMPKILNMLDGLLTIIDHLDETVQ